MSAAYICMLTTNYHITKSFKASYTRQSNKSDNYFNQIYNDSDFEGFDFNDNDNTLLINQNNDDDSVLAAENIQEIEDGIDGKDREPHQCAIIQATNIILLVSFR